MKITFSKPKFYALLTSGSLWLSLAAQLPATADAESTADAVPTPVNSADGQLAPSADSKSPPATSSDQSTLGPNAQGDAGSSTAANNGVQAAAASSSPSPDSATASDTSSPPPEVLPKKTQHVVLKPGQRIKIEGYAEGKEIQIIDDDKSATPEYHRVYMRLSGSMCMSCLHTFEERLKQVFGVERVKIVKGAQNTVQSFSPDLSNWADATIYYDAQHVTLLDIRSFSKNNGYVSYRVLDKLADSLPPEETNKSPFRKL